MIVLALACVLAAPVLGKGPALDDLLLREQFEAEGVGAVYRFVEADPVQTARRRASGELPWWTSDALEVDFWRPLAALAFGLDRLAWPNAPWLAGLHSLLWYMLAAYLVLAVYRVVSLDEREPARAWTPTGTAGLAALLWVVDDAHATTLGWIAARHSLIGFTLGLAGWLAHLRWRERRWRPGAVLGPLGLGLGLLASESALALLGYVLAHALVHERGKWTTRLASVAPHVLVAIAWLTIYLALGRGAAACGMYLDFVGDPLGSLARLPAHAALLLAAAFGPPMLVELAGFGPSAAYWTLALVAALLGASVLALLVPVLRRSASARTWALGSLLATLATGLALPADRHLLTIGLGSAGLVAVVLRDLFERRLASVLARALAFVWIVLHLVVAPLVFGVRVGGTSLVQAELDVAVERMAEARRRGDQPVVLLDAPSELLAMYAPATSSALGLERLELYLLYAGAGAVELERRDDQTLVVRADWMAAPGERSHRGPGHPMQVDDRVQLDHFAVVVEEVSVDGRPQRARLVADHPLEQLDLVWMVWDAGLPKVLALPEIGETRPLPSATWRFDRSER